MLAAADFMWLVLRQVRAINLEGRDVAGAAVVGVPVPSDLRCVLLAEDGMEDRLPVQPRREATRRSAPTPSRRLGAGVEQWSYPKRSHPARRAIAASSRSAAARVRLACRADGHWVEVGRVDRPAACGHGAGGSGSRPWRTRWRRSSS